MLNNISSNSDNQIINFSRTRVKSYSRIIDLCDNAQFGLFSFSQGKIFQMNHLSFGRE